MLVLTRRVNEKILIGKDIVVTLISTTRGQVRIGVEAPADVKIVRAEIADKPQEGKDDAKS